MEKENYTKNNVVQICDDDKKNKTKQKMKSKCGTIRKYTKKSAAK